MMLSCKRAAELTCQSLDRRLTLSERAQLSFHLAMCRRCAAFRRQSVELDRLIARRFRSEDDARALRDAVDRLPDETWHRMKRRLLEELDQG